MNVIQQILNATKRRGGCTINPVTGEIPTTGYLVSSGEHERKVPRVTYADIKAYAAEHNAAFSAKGSLVFLGTWKQSGITCLDISIRLADKESALTFGALNDQLAVYDIGKGVDIEVGS